MAVDVRIFGVIYLARFSLVCSVHKKVFSKEEMYVFLVYRWVDAGENYLVFVSNIHLGLAKAW